MNEQKVREKKVIGRSVAIALGIACIILVAGIGGVMAYYTMQINNKNAMYDSYVSAHSHTNTEFNTLQSNYTSLNSQVASLQAPKLVKVYLQSDDGGLPFQSRRLHIYGSLVNVGTNPAYNSKLHVVAYISQVVAIDTYIELGRINGESSTYIDQTITYSGGTPLSSWTITPQWTS